MSIAAWVAGGIILAGTLRLPVADELTRLSQQVFAEMGVYLVIAGVLFTLVNRWLALVYLSAAIAAFWPVFDGPSVVALNAWTLAAVLYLVIYLWGDDRAVLDAICLVVIAHVAFQVLQAAGADPVFTLKEGAVPPGMMTSSNETAALMGVGAFAFLRRERPALYVFGHEWRAPFDWCWLLPVPILGLALARSFGGALALGAGLAALGWLQGGRSRRLGPGALFAAAAIMALYLLIDLPESAGMRLQAWLTAIRKIGQEPVLGYGLGRFELTFPGTCTAWTETVYGRIPLHVVRWDFLHNDWLQWTYEQGLRFPVLLAGYLGNLLWRYRKTAAFWATTPLLAAACVGVLASSSVHWFLQCGGTAVIGVALFASLDRGLAK